MCLCNNNEPDFPHNTIISSPIIARRKQWKELWRKLLLKISLAQIRLILINFRCYFRLLSEMTYHASIVGYNFRACFLYSNIEAQNVFFKPKLEGLYTLLIHPFYTVENQFLPKIFKWGARAQFLIFFEIFNGECLEID